LLVAILVGVGVGMLLTRLRERATPNRNIA
jgi:uncharacterized membrane-anchored protein YhcB (DUF1043 family)